MSADPVRYDAADHAASYRLSPSLQSPARLALRSGLISTAVLGPLATVIAAVAGGVEPAVGAAAGFALVAAFFTVSVVLVERANRIDPQLTLPVGLGTYFVKIVLLGVVIYGTPLGNSDHLLPFAWSVVTGVLVWLVAQAVAVWRAPIPYVIPATNPPGTVTPGAQGEPPID